MRRKSEQEMVVEFEGFCQNNGLPLVSAEELIHEALTDEQRAWVSAFIDRWERDILNQPE